MASGKEEQSGMALHLRSFLVTVDKGRQEWQVSVKLWDRPEVQLLQGHGSYQDALMALGQWLQVQTLEVTQALSPGGRHG